MREKVVVDAFGDRWERISKPTAYKAYNSGYDIIICGCNLNPFGFWCPGVKVDIVASAYKPFSYVVQEYIYYNICDNDTGYYPAYYRRVRPCTC